MLTCYSCSTMNIDCFSISRVYYCLQRSWIDTFFTIQSQEPTHAAIMTASHTNITIECSTYDRISSNLGHSAIVELRGPSRMFPSSTSMGAQLVHIGWKKSPGFFSRGSRAVEIIEINTYIHNLIYRATGILHF